MSEIYIYIQGYSTQNAGNIINAIHMVYTHIMLEIYTQNAVRIKKYIYYIPGMRITDLEYALKTGYMH